MSEVACESRIAHVAVYGRGAIVTRRVGLPDALPEAPVDLLIGGVTPLANPASARARTEGERGVVALRMRLVVPAGAAGVGPLIERLRILGLERERLESERAQLFAQRQALTTLKPEADLKSRWRRVDAGARVEDALAASGLGAEVGFALDARLHEIAELVEKNARDAERAELEAAQGRSADRMGAGHPTREMVVRLGEGRADGLRGLEVSYVVGAARWWPTYSVRLGTESAGRTSGPSPASDGSARASWAIEALIAQASGEDWTGAEMSLCSASLVRDVRLPQLGSLRFGRAQTAPKKAYRPPPPGLDAMFASYDAAMADAPAPPAARIQKEVTRAMQPPPAPRGGVAAPPPPMMRPPPAPAAPMRAMMVGAAAPAATRSSGPPPPSPGSAHPPAGGAQFGGALEVAEGRGGSGDGGVEEEETSPERYFQPIAAIEPTEGWLDFDALTMAPADPGAARGRLVHSGDPEGTTDLAGAPARALVAIERLTPSPLTRDPREVSADGLDVRYDAAALADVPSNARPHRVAIALADGRATPRLVCAPREAASIYREATLTNPFPMALLPGPIDVFVDGALVTTTALGATGPGGRVTIGLGTEDRIRVARNARVDEGSGGLLGGTTTVDHAITVDLTSSLGHATVVEILERLPVSDEKDIDVDLRSAAPEPARYDQAERGAPVRGGMRWSLGLEPGGKARVEYTYRVSIPARSELVGGNRRD